MSAQNVPNPSIPNFRPGDTVKVHLRVAEGDSERIQVFEGVVITRRGRGISESFTVRKISFGVGVERTFPVQSPRIQKIELARAGKVRRARLYYLRELTGKAARLAEGSRNSEVKPSAGSSAPPAPAPRVETAPAA